jgi:hypothetical protein
VQLIVLPFGLGSRIALALCGSVVLLFNIDKQTQSKKDIFIQKDIIQYFFVFAALIIISFIALVLNNTRDFEFVKYPLSITFILLACYFLHFLIKKVHKKITYEIIMRYIMVAVLIQVLVSLVSYLSPQVNTFLIHIQNLNELDTSKIEETGAHRFIGFGSTFFGAGLINGFALMVIAVLLKDKRLSGIKIFMYSMTFFIILLLGVMMARTTLVGFGFALLYLFMPSFHINRSTLRNRWMFLVYLLIIPVIGIGLLYTFSPGTISELTAVLNFSFELFINYSQTGQFSTASTTALESMYVFPHSFKTYLIGDGQYYLIPGDRSSAYYMHTDVGYLRLVYYFGLTGMLCYFLLQYFVIRNAKLRNAQNKNFVRFLSLSFLFGLILNTKAFTDLIFLTILFCYPFREEKYEARENLYVPINP